MDRPDCSLFVRVKQRHSLADIFKNGPSEQSSNLKVPGPRIIPFGMIEDTCSEEVFNNRNDERIAKAIHQRFVDKRKAGSNRTPESDPAMSILRQIE